MKKIGGLLIVLFGLTVVANTAELSTATSQDLLSLYKELRTMKGSTDTAAVEDVVLKRDAATFHFASGKFTFAASVSGRVLAAQFRGEGSFELEPPSPIDQRQIARFAGGPTLKDTFSEAVFFFTDDSYAELSSQLIIKPAPSSSSDAPFAAFQQQYSTSFNDWIDNRRKENPVMRNLAARMLADLTDVGSKGFFFADFKAKKSGNLIFHISWNRDSLLLPAYGKGEEVMLLHTNPGNYYEWWSGFHLSTEYAQSAHPDHPSSLLHCSTAQIDLQISKFPPQRIWSLRLLRPRRVFFPSISRAFFASVPLKTKAATSFLSFRKIANSIAIRGFYCPSRRVRDRTTKLKSLTPRIRPRTAGLFFSRERGSTM
jgi:hypothetical protein